MHSENDSPDPSLTPQQHRVIHLLAAGQSVTQAAASEKIHRNTIGYWRRSNPAFSRELEFVAGEQRQYWQDQATELAPQAILNIQDALIGDKSSPSLRFRAAVLIVKMATDPEPKLIHSFSHRAGVRP